MHQSQHSSKHILSSLQRRKPSLQRDGLGKYLRCCPRLRVQSPVLLRHKPDIMPHGLNQDLLTHHSVVHPPHPISPLLPYTISLVALLVDGPLSRSPRMQANSKQGGGGARKAQPPMKRECCVTWFTRFRWPNGSLCAGCCARFTSE